MLERRKEKKEREEREGGDELPARCGFDRRTPVDDWVEGEVRIKRVARVPIRVPETLGSTDGRIISWLRRVRRENRLLEVEMLEKEEGKGEWVEDKEVSLEWMLRGFSGEEAAAYALGELKWTMERQLGMSEEEIQEMVPREEKWSFQENGPGRISVYRARQEIGESSKDWWLGRWAVAMDKKMLLQIGVKEKARQGRREVAGRRTDWVRMNRAVRMNYNEWG